MGTHLRALRITNTSVPKAGWISRWGIALVLFCLIATATGRERGRSTNFNAGWRFSLAADAHGDASAPAFNDSSWRGLDLPHDWSVEAAFDENLEGATGYLPGGIGWYRKHFATPVGVEGRVVYLLFDGVYNNAEFWINGTKLGFHPYGYSPFYFDLTPHLKPGGGENVLAVRVDRTRYCDSRWYTGSGIYRDVSLIVTDTLHVPVWGTFVTTPAVTPNEATIAVQTEVKNAGSAARDFQLITTVLNPSGRKVAEHTRMASLPAGEMGTFTDELTVREPQLWDIAKPRLYTAVTTIMANEKVVDRTETRFGIRTLRYDPDQGFFLNGRHTLIKGVCLHHDGGLVGAAVPRAVWQRRLETLKAGGCNAIRTAHNPPSAEFLDLCDEMGFLVQDEFFDEWDYPKDKRLNTNEKSVDTITRGYTEHFQKWAERDLKNTMRRDRNHPSIVMWSIGNEIEWTYPQNRPATGYFDMDWKGNYFWTPPRFEPEEIRQRYEAQPKTEHMIGPTAQKLSRWTKELDTTRPVVANLILPSASHVSGYADALDLMGYSYRRVVYDYGHEHFPNKPILGTENLGQWHEWKAVIERPFVAGLFLWTGIDYLGESNDQWPRKATPSGLLDLAGFEKPSWHMFKTLWSDEPHLYIATQTAEESTFTVDESSGAVVEKKPGGWKQSLWFWPPVNEHWNYAPGETVIVEVYSNCEEVELFLNGKSLGTRRLADQADRIFKWAVPFAGGKLVAKGRGGAGRAKAERVTAEPPARIDLRADRKTLAADGRDAVHLVAQLVDRKGNPVRTDEREITFHLEGPGRLLGVDNGAPDSVQKFQSNRVVTHAGRALTIIQSRDDHGTIEVTASADGLKSKPVRVRVR